MRLRSLLAGTGVPFGMYVGKTPERDAEVSGIRMPAKASRADYEEKLAEVRRERRGETVYPPEEVCLRETMRTSGRQPRILLTNVKQLELLLTRQRDVELFGGARLDFVVFDEAHTFTGAQGAETACLIRRLRAFCGREAQETVCVATSAAIVDREDPDAARSFAARFFGVAADTVATVGEDYETEVWAEPRFWPPAPAGDPAEILETCVRAVEEGPDGDAVRAAYRTLAGRELGEGPWPEALYADLSHNELVFRLTEQLHGPRALDQLPPVLEEHLGRPVTEAEILTWLTLGAAARLEGRPLLRPVVHGFVCGISGAVVTFPEEDGSPKLWLAAEDEMEIEGDEERRAHFPVTTCTTCGQHYYIAFLKDFEFTRTNPGGGEVSEDGSYWEPLEETQGGQRVVLLDSLIGGSDDDELEELARAAPLYFCRRCGAAHMDAIARCRHCGVASLLDYLRRKRILHDPEREIFTKYWLEGELEIQQGYLPQIGNPVGTKLRRGAEEEPKLVTQWLSERGDTTIRQIARKWGVASDDAPEFLESLFRFLTEQRLLVPVRLKGSRGRPLPNVSGVYQVDADRLRLKRNHGLWRCRSCRRRTTRRTPHQRCPAWRCEAELEFVREDSDNYDLQLLDQRYSMLRPEEHAAMVPHETRERLENLFKSDSEAVNCFVCTPTLELGVDIGKLDAVLMRNVPPLPANYWQRAGRAGRRHRMAVDMTYCRPVSHDRAYFADPPKLLAGRVDPPAFNLRNDVMVAKHVHATVITRLHQYLNDTSRVETERDRIEEALRTCLPDRVSSYLFEQGAVRDRVFDLRPLEDLVANNTEDLVAYVARAFRQGWPAEDAEVTTPEALRGHVQGFVDGLAQVVTRLQRRLRWALEQITRLNAIRERQGDLEPEDEALFRRCDRLVRRLKGTARRTRREAEGYEDVHTFGVLAAEGFLPGYGLEVGSVLGTAEIPYWQTGAMDFSLPRPPSVALREYVPGNLIYANGHRFVARRFHRDVDEEHAEMPVFEVSAERQAVKPTSVATPASTLGGQVIQTIAVCDVDLVHQSHISDEEELRFRMGVAIYGLERDRHAGGRAYRWGPQSLHLRRGVRLRLVNVGATSAIDRNGGFGYPICTVCGQSVSPLSSDRQRQHFDEAHLDRCRRAVTPVGFYADVVADVLSLPGSE